MTLVTALLKASVPGVRASAGSRDLSKSLTEMTKANSFDSFGTGYSCPTTETGRTRTSQRCRLLYPTLQPVSGHVRHHAARRPTPSATLRPVQGVRTLGMLRNAAFRST